MPFFFPPPPVFTGGAQPYGQVHLVQSGTATPSDNPPFGYWDTINSALESTTLWQPLPPLPTLTRKLFPPSVQIDQPLPSSDQATLDTILAAWVPPPPLPTIPIRSADLPGWSIDYPPWDRFAPTPWAVPDRTIPFVPQRFVPVGAQINNPAFMSQYNWQVAVADAWQPSPPLPTLIEKFPFSFTPDNPIPTLTQSEYQISGIGYSWQPPPPLPTLGNKLVQINPSDNPPFSSRFIWEINVLAAWQPLPPLPTMHTEDVAAIPTFAPDNPQFNGSGQGSGIAALAWQPAFLLPALGAKIATGPFIPDSPPVSTLHNWLPGIIQAWQPVWQQPQELLPVVQPSVTPMYNTSGWLPQVLQAWLPGFLLPSLGIRNVTNGLSNATASLVEADDVLSGTILGASQLAGALVENPDVLSGIISSGGAASASLTEANDILLGIIAPISVALLDPRYTIIPRSSPFPGMLPLSFQPTSTNDRVPLAVDFTYLLPPGVGLAGGAVTVQVAPISLVPDTVPDTRLDGVAVIIGNNLLQWFHNGVSWADYFLTFRVTLSNGETVSITANIFVESYILF